MSTAYTHTPLAKKLNLKLGMATCVIDVPDGYWHWLDLPSPLSPTPPPYQWAHVFATQRAALEAHVAALRSQITPDGMIWVSWPKKAAKLPTDITEDVVREVAFAHKLVDVKVCAVNEIWSGLKLVIRRQDR